MFNASLAMGKIGILLSAFVEQQEVVCFTQSRHNSIEHASCKSQVFCKSQNVRCTVAPFQRGILLTDQEEASLFKIDEKSSEICWNQSQGSQDGLGKRKFYRKGQGMQTNTR